MTSFCPGFLAARDPALCRPVDHYCERLTSAFDAEPVNALTNLAFLVAGWMAWRRFRNRDRFHEDRLLGVTILAIPVIGIGSMVFHTIAQRWAEWVDVIPILAFSLLCLWLAMSRVLGWSWPVRTLLLVLYTAATISLEAMVPGDVLWGGAMHVPTLAALLVLGWMPERYTGSARPGFQLLAAIFVAAVSFRSLDNVACTLAPIGTHFLWHLLTALLAYLWADLFLRRTGRDIHARAQAQAGQQVP